MKKIGCTIKKNKMKGELTMKTIVENGITYTEGEDGRFYPNLTEPKIPELSFYGRKWLRHLKENDSVRYWQMWLDETLYPHAEEVDRTAWERERRMIEQMKKAQGVTEELKANDMMTWVGMMNNIRDTVRQIIFRELIYV